jgi:hypothetical protein
MGRQQGKALREVQCSKEYHLASEEYHLAQKWFGQGLDSFLSLKSLNKLLTKLDMKLGNTLISG